MPPRLYLFIEGNDDERFFLNVLCPLLGRKYSEMQVIQYAEDPPKLTRKFIRSVQSARDEYVFVRDLDDAPCITQRKKKVVSRYKVDSNNIIVVVKEIECWYLCGLDDECCKKLEIERHIGPTDNMTREDFDALVPEGVSRVEFMQQILEKHKIEIGRQKNRSFRYFLEKWVE
jgi:hypothetical protein